MMLKILLSNMDTFIKFLREYPLLKASVIFIALAIDFLLAIKAGEYLGKIYILFKVSVEVTLII